MLRYKAFLFLFLVLSMCMTPAVQARNVLEHTETACTDHCCSLPDEDSRTENESASVCNPFQCHTCCFMLLPVFSMQKMRIDATFLSPQTHFAQTYRFSPGYDFWQPPRLTA